MTIWSNRTKIAGNSSEVELVSGSSGYQPILHGCRAQSGLPLQVNSSYSTDHRSGHRCTTDDLGAWHTGVVGTTDARSRSEDVHTSTKACEGVESITICTSSHCDGVWRTGWSATASIRKVITSSHDNNNTLRVKSLNSVIDRTLEWSRKRHRHHSRSPTLAYHLWNMIDSVQNSRPGPSVVTVQHADALDSSFFGYSVSLATS